MRQPPKEQAPADPAKRDCRRPTRRTIAAPEQSSRRDTPAADASADSAQRLHKPDEKKRKQRAAKSRPRRRRKRVRIGEALRKIGFDEYAIAQNYADTAKRLKAKPDKSGNIEKLLIDVLKECSRLIEPVRPAEPSSNNSRVAGAAIHVHLVHNVPRPARGGLTSAVSSPIILDVPSPVAALPSAEAPQTEQDLAPYPELA